MDRIILAGTLIFRDDALLLVYRRDHKHWETPGGKVEKGEVLNPMQPTVAELFATAKRELHEEVGGIVVDDFAYFGNVEFTVPDGRKAIAHKFTARYCSGVPYAKEEIFEKIAFLPLRELHRYTISPDLQLFLPKLQKS